MKAKKVLSFILVAVMLFSVLSISASAEPLTYTGSVNISVPKNSTLDVENFKYELVVNQDIIGVFDGENADYEAVIRSIVTGDGNFTYDYLTDPEGFLNVFTKDEKFAGGSIDVEYEVSFASTGIFGELECTVNIDGFSVPQNLGGDGLGDIMGSVGGSSDSLAIVSPQTLSKTGSVANFPEVDLSTVSVLGVPQKTDYLDSEKYDANGLQLSFTTTAGVSGILTYNEDNAHAFTFVPSAKENLSVGDSEVAVMVTSKPVYYSPITVSHGWSTGPVNITTYKYTDSNPGFHAIVCEGCGETHDAQLHVVDPDGWTKNNDQTFVANGTESNTCLDCGTVLIRDDFQSADYNETFGDMHFLLVIFDYINALLRIIGTAFGV